MDREDRNGPMGEVQTERPGQEDFPGVVRGFGWRGGRGQGKGGINNLTTI